MTLQRPFTKNKPNCKQAATLKCFKANDVLLPEETHAREVISEEVSRHG